MLTALLLVALQDDPLPLGAEGPLGNDVFLPVEGVLDDGVAQGDGLLAEARAAAAEPATARNAERLFHEAFDAWLVASPARRAGEALLWHPAERAPERRRIAEDADAALVARVEALAPAERALWRAHVGSEADDLARRLGTAPNALRSVEASFPATDAAARAALVLADRAIAAGRLGDARRWTERARQHLELAGEAPESGGSAELGAALRVRAAWLDARAPAFTPPPFADGARLERAGAVALSDPIAEYYAGRGAAAPQPGRGVRPGGVVLADGRLAVQTASRVHLVTADSQAPRIDAVFTPADLLTQGVDRPADAARADGSPGWPLLPATDGTRLVLVLGRADQVQAFGSEEIAPNALVCVTPPPPSAGHPRAPGTGPRPAAELPRLAWAILGDRRLAPDGALRPLASAAPLANLELQPGPVIVGDAVVVQARTVSGELAAWLLAFDLWTGETRWARMLAHGADLAAEGSRFQFGRPRRPAAQPLARVGELVFAGTHLGSAHLVDPLDGRILWSLTYRRRAASDAGWAGARPVVTPTEILLAPADSDRLYALSRERTPPRTAPLDALVHAVLPIGEGEALLGAAPAGFVLQGRAGPEHAVFERSRDGAARRDAVYLGRAEAFRSVGIVAGSRALECSDRGLYLFDLERDLALSDYAWLAPPEGPPRRGASKSSGVGGEIVLDGRRIWVVGVSGVWLVRATE